MNNNHMYIPALNNIISRLDSDALFHEHKVNLTNVFDTQVAYAVVTRGKGYSTPLPVGLNTLLRYFE